jgi:hypothetical protein
MFSKGKNYTHTSTHTWKPMALSPTHKCKEKTPFFNSMHVNETTHKLQSVVTGAGNITNR